MVHPYDMTAAGTAPAVSPRRVLGLLAVLFWLGGCILPAQMLWSPDGKQAAYQNQERAVLLDDRGHKLAELGRSVGGFAWTSDSRGLYYATADDPDKATQARRTDVHFEWFTLSPAALESNAAAAKDPAHGRSPERWARDQLSTSPSSTLWLRRGDAAKPLAEVPGRVGRMLLSPDQKWLCIQASTGPEPGTVMWLFVYSLARDRLYLITGPPPYGACFTAPNRLAYVQWPEPQDVDRKGRQVGKPVELVLDESTKVPERHVLADDLPGQVIWLRPVGEELWMLVYLGDPPGAPEGSKAPAKPPAAPAPTPRPDRAADGRGGAEPASGAEDCPIKLYRLRRGDRAVSLVLPDLVQPLLVVSPDGRRALVSLDPRYQQPKADGSAPEAGLYLLETASSRIRRLFDRAGWRMWPAWRTNDEFAFTLPEPTGSRVVRAAGPTLLGPTTMAVRSYEVVLYHIDADGSLRVLRTLSQDWDDGLKPTDGLFSGGPEEPVGPATRPAAGAAPSPR